MKIWIPGLLLVALMTGCSTTSMKGTPFYTGEHIEREGPAADRVNLWPLLYYRDPALSVLWPLMESSPDHLAVRPIYSVYGRNTDQPVHNVLWPIARFDKEHQNYRIFPVYWGDEYLTLFPFYWHKDDPFSDTGHNAFFPLWVWQNKQDGYSLDVAWPLCAKKQDAEWQHWRVWPVAGSTDKPGYHYSYYAWPFIHHWNKADKNTTGHVAFPLYGYERNDDYSKFISLLYSRSVAGVPQGKSWDLTMPLLYRQWQGDAYNWTAIPALSWGSRDGDLSKYIYALGLARYYSAPDRISSHVIPFYYYNRDEYGKAFYTLPWWSRTYADDSGWHSLFPLYFRGYSADESSFYSLPWWSKKREQGTSWHTTMPLYYYSYGDKQSAFYSLPWFSEKHADGSQWSATFPLYYSSRSDEGSMLLTPLYARKLQADGAPAWQCIFPVVYLDKTKDAHFMTLLGGRWVMGDQYNWLALPLLSGGSRDAESGRNIWLAGLAGQQWLEDEKSHYVIPFYYAAPYAGAFVSLPYISWQAEDRQTHLLPLLLSGWYNEAEKSAAVLACGLAGYRSGEEKPYNYVFPLYYAAPGQDKFFSLPYSSWRSGDRKTKLVLPLLSSWYDEGDANGAFLAAGLAGYRYGDEAAYNYAFPFYYSSEDTFVSLLYSSWESNNRRSRMFPLLLSGKSTEDELSDTYLLGGLGAWQTKGGELKKSRALPFYLWEKDRYFYTALYGKNEDMEYYVTPLAGRYGDGSSTSGSWIYPFYRHKRMSEDEAWGRYLLLGHYNKTSNRSEHGFYGIYGYNKGESISYYKSGRLHMRDETDINYFFFLGNLRERREYQPVVPGGKDVVSKYTRHHSFFPFWNKKFTDQIGKKERLKTSSLLGFLYDSRHEQKEGEEPHDYLRKRVLWRVYHQEKLNGDSSTDVFPAITVDSYKNGYYKCTFLWRAFRYERNPETGETNLDVLFIPLRRSKAEK